jgi:hypothetical protein
LTATATDLGAAPVYQFAETLAGGLTQVVRDFSTGNTFNWTPMREGNYTIKVTVKDGFGDATGESATQFYTAASRVAGYNATISPTSNPLVALYSAPPSPGGSMIVQFRLKGSGLPWRSTAPLPIVPGTSTNFLVAGLLPNKTYVMRHVLDDGRTSPILMYRTGALPSYLTFPKFTVQKDAKAAIDPTQSLVFHVGINAPPGTVDTLATDRTGNVAWYFDPVANAFPSYAPSLVPGGTVLLLGGTQDGTGGADTVREVDLAGNTVHETNVHAVNAQLAALGVPSIVNFNHDAQRLPNGDTAVIAATTRTINLNGTPTQYTGDMILVLDRNFQVNWAWDPFTWLNTNRLPTLGEGARDWTHANSVAWSPADGNLIVSLRSQDEVVKIEYANGTGDGRVLWRLGRGGDFTLLSSNPNDWFSHQHDVTYINPTTLMLFDNGNVRNSTNPHAKSRGQVLALNEATKQARLLANVTLSSYAMAVGSAQRLPNGDLVFDSGFLQQTIEVRPNGKPVYILKMVMPGLQYRSFIYSNLYGNPANDARPAAGHRLVTASRV